MLDMLTLSLTAFLICAATATKCAAPPLSLPYRDVSIVPGVLSPGFPLQLGSPFQSVALVPSLQLDDTFIPRYTNTCVYNVPANTTATQRQNATSPHASITDLLARDAAPGSFAEADRNTTLDSWTRCAQTYGGAYDPLLSSSFAENKTVLNNQDGYFFTDTWRFADYLSVYTTTTSALPPTANLNLTGTFRTVAPSATFGGYASGLLGLTPNSTLLATLVHAGIAPSTSWTLSNTSLCLGCEDRSLSTGAWHAFHPADVHTESKSDSNAPCLIRASVSALTYRSRAQDADGATLIASSFTACVDPGVGFLVLPPDAATAFGDVVDSDVRAAYEDYTVFERAAGNETGVVTVRLEGGLEVNVTLAGAGATGDADVEGEGEGWKVPIGKGGWGAYGNATWVLGRPFTERVVLRWDGVKGEYSIANRETAGARAADVHPLGCDAFPGVEKSVASTLAAGALVGSVFGGFVAGLAFAFAGVWFFRRGQKGARSRYAQLDEDTVPMRAMSRGREDWMDAGVLSTPPASVHEGWAQRMGDTRGGAQRGLGYEIGGGQRFEAPGTKRGW